MTKRLPAIEIVPFAGRHAQAFHDLNIEWISTYFTVEELDRRQISHPEREIVAPGGQIFMAEMDGKIIGCVAMIPIRPDEFELAKMAVTPSAQGRGAGGLLLERALSWARHQKAKSVMLLSNRNLAPALHLYEKHGFKEVAMDAKAVEYERCDITMRLEL